MTVEGLTTDETLVVLKLVFLVLLYAFIVLVMRTATKDLGGAPQESIVLGPSEAARLRAEHGVQPVRFLVVAGPGLRVGATLDITASTVVGRDPGSGIRLDGDEFASGRHARIDPAPGGTWVEDLGSTNGTYVNGEQIDGRQALQPGDVVRIGETELRLE